jgi:hypothetical protein
VTNPLLVIGNFAGGIDATAKTDIDTGNATDFWQVRISAKGATDVHILENVIAPGGSFELGIASVRKRIGDAEVRMLAYNGSVPGPTLRVAEGSEIEVDVVNEGDLEATVHWHGLRLDNRSDGTHETQAPIPIGGRYSCTVAFPDPGLYWYHPHIREDYGQEMGLYGNVIVEPADRGTGRR